MKRINIGLLLKRTLLPLLMVASLILAACNKGGNTETSDAVTTGDPGGTGNPALAKAGPVYYLDEAFMSTLTLVGTGGNPMPSGWDIDTRGGELVAATASEFSIWDKSPEFPVVMEREISEVKQGTVTFETAFILKTADGEFYYAIKNSAGDIILKLFTQKDELGYADASGAFQRLSRCDVMLEYALSVDLNLDSGKADIRVNGKRMATVDLLSEKSDMKYITVGTTDAGKAYVILKFVRVFQNYLINEKFISAAGNISDRWEVQETNKGYCELVTKSGSTYPDQYSLSMFSGGSGENIGITQRFDRAKGNFVFQTSFLLTKRLDDVEFLLHSGSESVVTVRTSGENILYGTKALYPYQADLWYILRIEADTRTGKAIIKINGRKISEETFAADYIDGITIRNNSPVRGTLTVDDIYAFVEAEYSDYVPEPVAAKSDGYYIGMQSCSLWRSGYHVGWDAVTPFEEITPYLGYYDEGTPEVADWEIKWMVEHGIDYNLFCWFLPLNWNKSDPIQKPYTSEALHDGYFNAKYSDRMSYAIMWENYSAVVTSEIFREKIVPFWVEYYFKDPRYMKVDNKPVITIYQWSNLVKSFGDAEGVRRELDYLREVCRGLGFDGAIILIQCSDLDAQNLATVSSLGFDAMYRYSWGGVSYNIENQKSRTLTQKSLATIDVVPNASMGYNNVAWNGLRNPYVTISDYKTLLDWFKNTYMTSYNADSLASKMLFLDNWNEYGEGHYMMPSSLAGFDYLDAVRETFTSAPAAHEDTIPTDAQKARINLMFPQDRVVLRHLFTNNVTSPGYIFKIDGKTQTLDEAPANKNNVLMVPFNPVRQVFEKLYVVYKYDAPTKELRIWRDDVSIVFTIGSATARVNGQEVNIGCEVYLEDGLPMLPIKLICDTFGYKLEAESIVILVYTDQYEKITESNEAASDANSGIWEFNVDNDFVSWTPSRSIFNFTVENSLLSGSVKGDYGTIKSGKISVNASTNRYLHIRIKSNAMTGNNLEIFFITAADSVWGATKMLTLPLEKSDDFKEYVIDMGTSANWSGAVTQLMINLCRGGGTFEIDYIRLSSTAITPK